MKEISSITVRWDEDTDPGNPGWLMHYVSDDESDFIAFSAPYYHLPLDADDKSITTAVIRTLYDERMCRAEGCELTIDRS